MWRKLGWLAVAGMLLATSSGCRLCERWYENRYDPDDRYDRRRPNYYAPQGQGQGGCYCPPVQQCPPGCAPVGASYGGFAPAPATICPPGCVPAG